MGTILLSWCDYMMYHNMWLCPFNRWENGGSRSTFLYFSIGCNRAQKISDSSLSKHVSRWHSWPLYDWVSIWPVLDNELWEEVTRDISGLKHLITGARTSTDLIFPVGWPATFDVVAAPPGRLWVTTMNETPLLSCNGHAAWTKNKPL